MVRLIIPLNLQEKLVCNLLLGILLYSQVSQEGHQSIVVSEGGAKD